MDRPADRGRSMLGAALLRRAVASHTGCDPADVVVDRTCTDCGGPHGAPMILHPSRGLGVSVSHSGLLVVVALNPRGPVGVDVQRVSELSDPAAGGEWSRREALFKAGAVPRDERGPGSRVTPPPAGWTLHALHAPLAGYAAALAVPGGTRPELVVGQWPGRPDGPLRLGARPRLHGTPDGHNRALGEVSGRGALRAGSEVDVGRAVSLTGAEVEAVPVVLVTAAAGSSQGCRSS